MGQRHQLFVISKLASGRYRSLAVAHHQWLYGQAAVEACKRLIRIFQEPSNHALIAYEQQLADKAPDKLWNKKMNWANDVPEFPFIATCLLVGVSLDPSTGKGANVHNLQFNTNFDDGDNNDGITVLDITNPAQVRYAFVALEVGTRETKNFKNTPLTAYEYAASYDSRWNATESDSENEGDSDEGSARGSSRAEDEDGSTDDHDMPPKLVRFLRSQKTIDTTEIPAPLIDEDTLESAWPAAWRKRSEVKLPAVPALSFTAAQVQGVSDTSSHGDSDSLQALHEAFVRSHRALDPLYEEPVENTEAAPSTHPHIKQIVHIATPGKPWRDLARDCNPYMQSLANLAVWTFPVDDIPLTAGRTLDIVQTWIQWARWSRDWEFYFEYFQSNSTQPQTLIKAFSLAGPEHLVVKPWPGKAFSKAKMHFSSSGTPIECTLDAINPGEWTVLVATDCKDGGMSNASAKGEIATRSFKCGFVTRDAKGELVVADAAEFRRLCSSGPAYEAAIALDGGEEDYGKKFVDVLASEERMVGRLPVSVLGMTEVVEVLDMIKRHDANMPPGIAQMREAILADRKAKAKAYLARQA